MDDKDKDNYDYKITDVEWTMHDCSYSSSITTDNDVEITWNGNLFEDWESEVLRDKYPELQNAWIAYQQLLQKYKMWDNLTQNPNEDDILDF